MSIASLHFDVHWFWVFSGKQCDNREIIPKAVPPEANVVAGRSVEVDVYRACESVYIVPIQSGHGSCRTHLRRDVLVDTSHTPASVHHASLSEIVRRGTCVIEMVLRESVADILCDDPTSYEVSFINPKLQCPFAHKPLSCLCESDERRWRTSWDSVLPTTSSSSKTPVTAIALSHLALHTAYVTTFARQRKR
jgi:hypothetical protein